MRVRIKSVNHGQVVDIRVDDADEDDMRRLLGGGRKAGRHALSGGADEATQAMVAAGIRAFLARGDTARLGAALAEVWTAMERVRRHGDGFDGDD